MIRFKSDNLCRRVPVKSGPAEVVGEHNLTLIPPFHLEQTLARALPALHALFTASYSQRYTK